MTAGFRYGPATGPLFKKPVGPVQNQEGGNPTAATSENDFTRPPPSACAKKEDRTPAYTPSKKAVQPIQFVVDEEQPRLQPQTIALAVV